MYNIYPSASRGAFLFWHVPPNQTGCGFRGLAFNEGLEQGIILNRKP